MHDVAADTRVGLFSYMKRRPALHHDHDLKITIVAMPAGAVFRRTIEDWP